MWTKIKNLASLYRELGPRWTIFRLAYAFRLRTGIIRLQMPQSSWETYRAERSDERLSRHADEAQLPEDVPWNKQVAIDEADKILSGEIKYFSHQFIQTGFPLNWHKDYFSSYVTLSASEGSLLPQSEILRSQQPLPQNDMYSNKHWSQISDDHVVARRALALPDEAIPNTEETASAKTKSASQRHGRRRFLTSVDSCHSERSEESPTAGGEILRWRSG